VPDPPIATDLHQALDVLAALTPQIALNDEIAIDDVTELGDLIVREIADLPIRLDPKLGEDHIRGRTTDPVDVGESDLHALVEGDVDPCDASHADLLALPLLVPRVLADHEHPAVTADDLALFTHRLNRRSYLHDPFRLMIQTGWLWWSG
jgi:hypothetical protein